MTYKELKKDELFKVCKIRNYTIDGDEKNQYLVEGIMGSLLDNYIVVGTGLRGVEMDIDLVSARK